MARARRRRDQWARPVRTVNAEGSGVIKLVCKSVMGRAYKL